MGTGYAALLYRRLLHLGLGILVAFCCCSFWLRQAKREDGLLPGSLVFDVGFNDGKDSLAYLTAGHRVVAVEANPQLTAAAESSDRFAPWLRSGQLTLLTTCVIPDSQERGNATFYVSKCTSEWSSIFPEIGCRSCTPPHARSSGACTALTIKADRCQDLLQRYGKVEYLKIDIEGADLLCVKALNALQPSMLPVFVSIEVTDEVLTAVDTLFGLGYKYFKLVIQQCFDHGTCSGPWGDAALDCRARHNWRPYAEVRHDLTELNQRPKSKKESCPGMKDVPGEFLYIWYDVHASRAPEGPRGMGIPIL